MPANDHAKRSNCKRYYIATALGCVLGLAFAASLGLFQINGYIPFWDNRRFVIAPEAAALAHQALLLRMSKNILDFGLPFMVAAATLSCAIAWLSQQKDRFFRCLDVTAWWTIWFSTAIALVGFVIGALFGFPSGSAFFQAWESGFGFLFLLSTVIPIVPVSATVRFIVAWVRSAPPKSESAGPPEPESGPSELPHI